MVSGFGLEGAARGVARGFDIGLTLDQNERAERRLDLQEEAFEQRMDERELEQAIREYQLEALEDEQFRKRFLRSADLVEYSLQQTLDPEARADWQRRLQSDPSLQREVTEAWQTVAEPMINRGEPQGARKRLAGVTPVDGSGEQFALRVQVEPEDGEPYTAPLTENRGTDPDDPVMTFTWRDLVGSVAQAKHLAQRLDMARLRQGDRSPLEREDDDSAPYRISGGYLYNQETGEYERLPEGGEGAGGGVGSGFGLELSPYNIQTGDNQIRQILATRMGGSVDAMGNLSLPEGNSEHFGRALGLAQTLHRQYFNVGTLNPGTFADVAFEATRDLALDPDSAVAVAQQEAEQRGGGGFFGIGAPDEEEVFNGLTREEWIERRAEEILQRNMGVAQQRAEQLLRERMGGRGGSDTAAPATGGGFGVGEAMPRRGRGTGESAAPARGEGTAGGAGAGRTTGGEIPPELLERARTDPKAYREVLRRQYPDYPAEVIDQRVEQARQAGMFDQ